MGKPTKRGPYYYLPTANIWRVQVGNQCKTLSIVFFFFFLLDPKELVNVSKILEATKQINRQLCLLPWNTLDGVLCGTMSLRPCGTIKSVWPG